MSAGFDVHSCKAIKGRGENSTSIFNSLFMTNGNYTNFIFIGNVTPLDAYAASLNIVLKDHSCEKAIQILKESQSGLLYQNGNNFRIGKCFPIEKPNHVLNRKLFPNRETKNKQIYLRRNPEICACQKLNQ